MKWFRFYDDVVNDPKVQRLPAHEFKAQFLAALQGADNGFSRYLRRGSDRPAPAIWAKARAFVFSRDNFTCQYCGERGGRLECDHVVPLARGGSSEPSNLATSCKPCNRSKSAKTPEEWGGVPA